MNNQEVYNQLVNDFNKETKNNNEKKLSRDELKKKLRQKINSKSYMRNSNHIKKNINFYENYNKILDNESNISKINQKTVKHLSCQFPIMSNVTYGLNKKSFENNNNNSIIIKLYNYLIYGKSNFLDKLSN